MDLGTEGRDLVKGPGPERIGTDHPDFHALLLEIAGKLCSRGGLTAALQACHEDCLGLEPDFRGCPDQPDQFLVHDPEHVLADGHALGRFFLKGAGADGFGQLHDELDIDIRGYQRPLEVLDQLVDGSPVDHRLAGQFLERVLERRGEPVEHQAPPSSSRPPVPVQRGDIIVGLAGAEEHERFSDRVGDRDRCTAPRVHVRLGEDHRIRPDGLVELECPGHRIVAGNRFIHIDHEIGLHDPFDLVELAHQVRLVMEPAGSIGKDDIDLMRVVHTGPYQRGLPTGRRLPGAG